MTEREDYRAHSYVFEFNQIWAEVKSSNPTTWHIQTDLFDEEDLAEKLNIPDEAINKRTEEPDLDPDSPSANLEELRALQKAGFEKFFSDDKTVIERLPEPEPSVSCAEFARIVAKWQEVKDLEPAGIEDALEREKLPSGRSYFSALKGLKTYTKAFFKIADDLKIPGIDWVVMSKKDLAKLILKKLPFFKRIFALQAILEIEFVFTIPFEMWMDFMEAQQRMRDSWYIAGRLTVIRQYLRRLIDLTFLKENDFPDHIDIDITTFRGAEDPTSPATTMSCGRHASSERGAAPDRLKGRLRRSGTGHRSDGRRDPPHCERGPRRPHAGVRSRRLQGGGAAEGRHL